MLDMAMSDFPDRQEKPDLPGFVHKMKNMEKYKG